MAPFTFVVLVVAQLGPDFPADFIEAPPEGFATVSNAAFPVEAPPPSPRPVIERSDLRSYFAEGPLRAAKAAFDAGNHVQARMLLDGVPDTAPVRYLRAVAAQKAGDLAFAADELEALAEVYPALADRCRFAAAEAAASLPDLERAARLFAAVSPASRLHPDAALGRARALLELKRSSEARDVLAPLVDRPAPPWGRDIGAEALWLLAHASPTAKASRAALISLWASHPLSPRATKAQQRLGDVSTLGAEVLVTRAEALIEAHHNAEGLAILSPLLPGLKPPAPLACRAHLAAGKAQRKLRDHSLAVTTLTPVTRSCRDGDLVARALYTTGISLSLSAPARAAPVFEALASRFPESPLADDALLFAAESRLKRGERDAAWALLTRLVDEYPTADMTSEALFRLHWMLRDERPADALVFLEEIEGRFSALDDTLELERAAYWRGRALESMGQRSAALDVYERVARDHPASYYGLIARERVGAIDPQRGAALERAVAAADEAVDPFPLELDTLPDDLHFRSAVELVRLGLPEGVVADVLAVDRSRLSAGALMVLVQLLAMAGETKSAHGLARLWLKRALSGPITGSTRALFELAYPHEFAEPVATWAQDSGVDPELVFALMREESALDPRALSWAGALGLCQLMPATAREVAGWLKLRPPSTAALLEPELNIRLGSRYLAVLLRRAGGVTQYALAGYNAGEGSVARWRAARRGAPLDEWVESIPVPETRGYVRRVLRSYTTYKLLYAPRDVARSHTQVPARGSKG